MGPEKKYFVPFDKKVFVWASRHEHHHLLHMCTSNGRYLWYMIIAVMMRKERKELVATAFFEVPGTRPLARHFTGILWLNSPDILLSTTCSVSIGALSSPEGPQLDFSDPVLQILHFYKEAVSKNINLQTFDLPAAHWKPPMGVQSLWMFLSVTMPAAFPVRHPALLP